MKRSLRKILLITMMALTFCVIFAVCAMAESFTLTYYHNDSAKTKEIYEEGEEITLLDSAYNTPDSLTFYGWFSDDGVLYTPGQKITLTRDMSVYQAVGKVVNNESELLNDFKNNGWVYLKLGKNMSLTQRLDATHGSNWTTHILDLNGHNLTISNTQYGTGAIRNGVIFVGKGTINFTSNNTKDGAFCETCAHGYGDGSQRLWIGKDVVVNSNAPLLRVSNDMSKWINVPSIRLWGKITCTYLVRSTGLQGVDVNVYPTADITITGTDGPLLRDTSAHTKINIMNLVFHGGKITLPSNFGGFVEEERPKCFSVKISGGTFNIDIAKYISVDYKTVKNADNTYSVVPNLCSSPDSPDTKHKYLASAITVTCLEDGTVDYNCEYCNDAYTAYRFALGHNVITMKTSDMYPGDLRKPASPGIYTHTCARCGSVESEFFYPDPATVYVDVKVKYKRDGINKTDTIRVKSTELFGFNIDTDTVLETATFLTSYGTTALKYTFSDGREESFKQSEIVGIEIPLGTTKISGGYQHGTYTGLFYKNDVIQEVTLPMSMQNVMQGAFGSMANLSKVNGIEYISENIGEYAFGQSKENAHLVFDTLKVNATTVDKNSFKNALATRVIIGENVRVLRDAFPLDGDISKIEENYDNKKGMLKEVFVDKIINKYPIEENENMYGKKLSEVWASLSADDKAKLFSEFSSNSALLTRAYMYYDHTYHTKKYEPTCISQGYTAYECVQCGLSTKSDFVPNDGITHVWERSKDRDVQPTCSKDGYTTEYCKICDSVQKLETIKKDPTKHDFSKGDPVPDFDACTNTTFHYRRQCAYGCGAWSENKQNKVTVDTPLGHLYSNSESDIEKIPASCGSPGQSIKTCSRCGSQDIVETPATGVHNMIRNDSKRVAPTCASVGYNYFNCKDCEATETQIIPQLSFEEAKVQNAHKWEDVIVFEATKNSEGMKETICTLCHQKGARSIIPKITQEGMPIWLIIVISVAGVAVVVGVGLTIYFTLFKKNNASKNYKYKFNTFKK